MEQFDKNFIKKIPITETGNNTFPLVLTVPEAAKQLRIGIGRCYELARCGQLRSIKIGKRILVPRAAIFEFLGMPDETPA